MDNVRCLSNAAKAYPHAAYCALTRSLSCEWAYVQRVIGEHDDEYGPLRDAIQQFFTPAILGREVLHEEHELFALPAKYGGLAIPDPTLTATVAYSVSKQATSILQQSVRSVLPLVINDRTRQCRSSTSQASNVHDTRAERLIESLPPMAKRTHSRIVKGNASGWLTVLPLRQEGYDMSAMQFRDQLAIRYGHEPSFQPSICDGCGAPFLSSIALTAIRVA